MVRRFCAWSVALVALAGAWPPGSLHAGPDRPFQGAAAGMVAGVIPPNGLVIEATGTATHLGRFTREELLFLGPDGSLAGTIVFTAANGDELWADVDGGFISPTTAVGTYTFTGGTGRFRGATGGAVFEAVTPDGVHVQAAFDGTIRY